MKVILLQDVPSLGKKGDLKDVAPGYARNHLLPRTLAVEATARRMKEWEQQRDKMEAVSKQETALARSQADELSRQKLLFKMAAGKGGRLFGSVTSSDIAEKLRKAGFAIDKKRIELDEQIKGIGSFKATIRLHPGVKAEVVIVVEKED